jgi:hypothetical protein
MSSKTEAKAPKAYGQLPGVLDRHAPASATRGNDRSAFPLPVGRSRQSRMLARLSFARKGSDHSFANRDETCARPFNASTLAADAGAFEQKRQGIRKQIRFCNSGTPTKFRQAIALVPLELFNDMPRRMIAFGKFNRRISEIATASIVENALGTDANPRAKLSQRIIRIFAIEADPNLVDLTGDVTQARDNQIILRAEVAVKRHLVGAGRLRDRVNADPPDPVLTEEITGRTDDAFPWP